MLQQNIKNISKHQDNKNHPKFVQTAKYCKRSFSISSWEFTTSNLWPYYTNSMKKCMDIANVSSVWRVYAFFTWKISMNQLNIRGVCRCHASINLFWLRKILIVLFVTKQTKPFCVRTGGDAWMKLPCSGLLPSIFIFYLFVYEQTRSP